MDMERATQGVLEAKTESELFSHLKAVLGLTGDIQENIKSLERLENLRSFYTDPNVSALDLYAARAERVASTVEAHSTFMNDSKITSIVRQKEQQLTDERLKKELIRLGESVCGEEIHSYLPALVEKQNNAENQSNILQNLHIQKCKYVTEEFNEVEKNKKHKMLRQKIAKVREKINTARNTFSGISPDEYDKAMQPLWDENKLLYNEINAFREVFHEKVIKKADEIFGDKISNAQSAYASAKQMQEEQESALFSFVTEKITSLSNITQEQANTWVEHNIFIAKNGEAKLQRIGYSTELLKKDLAEFYRYVGGKMGPICFVLEGRSQRAFARGKATIALQGDFSKKTLFHECAHLVEHWDPAFGNASQNFIEGRAEGKPVSLKKLTGAGYRPNEKAYPDHFIHPYVGKIYGSGSTEVLSMGIECLSDPQALAHFFKNDPEHFKLIMGVCKRQNPFLQEKFEQATDILSAKVKQQTRREAWEKALAKVSGTDFGKQLDAMHGGYMGYWIQLMGRSGLLYGPPEDGTSQSRCIYSGRVPLLRSLAYLLISHAKGKIYTEIPQEGGARQIVNLFKNGEVPEWFDSQKSLPQV